MYQALKFYILLDVRVSFGDKVSKSTWSSLSGKDVRKKMNILKDELAILADGSIGISIG